MAENTKIEWCDHTMNFWIGCQEVSQACDHCYARVQNEHWKWVSGWGPGGERRRTGTSNWDKLVKWNRDSGKAGIRAKVFSNSLSDFFDNKAALGWRREAWHYIEHCPNLDFLLLTKRPQNIAKMLPDPETGVKPWGSGWPNVWLGTTVENQEEADRRIPHLLAAPAAVRFLSCEPLLGPVQLHPSWLPCPKCRGRGWYLEQFSDNHRTACAECIRLSRAAGVTIEHGQQVTSGPRIDWVIAGGESGPNARPMHPDWARGLRDQCVAAGVSFFFKQWGEWAPGDAFGLGKDGPITDRRGNVKDWTRRYVVCNDRADRLVAHSFTRHATNLVYRVGKGRAGHLLDGVEWRQFPEPRP